MAIEINPRQKPTKVVLAFQCPHCPKLLQVTISGMEKKVFVRHIEKELANHAQR